MRHLLLPLLLSFLLVPGVHAAISLGDSGESIVARYGNPLGADVAHHRTAYQWNGWRLDIDFLQGTAHRLVFTKDVAPISEAEERQILNDNGGVASWQPVEGAASGRKWKRTADGAEAFSDGGRTLTLITKAWADVQAAKAFYAPVQSAAAIPQQSQATAVSLQAPADPLAPLLATLSQFAKMGVGAVILIGIVGLLVKQSSHAPKLRTSRSAPRQFRSACTLKATPTAEPAEPPERKTLADLSWQEFELVIGELYRRQGYAVEMCAGDGSDGGVDLTLRKDGHTTLVQCKHWKAYQVGVSTVRELFGVLTAEKADGAILVTTGKFTRDACLFAAGKPLELIEGNALDALIRRVGSNGQIDLLDVASWSRDFAKAATISDPECPLCHLTMVLRRGRQSGNRFWGCSTYPRCRGRRNVRVELMQARVD